MTEHLTNAQLENFTTHRLAAGELETVARHLAACAECRARVQPQAQTTARVAALQTSLCAEPRPHLSYEQLVAYVEETAAPVEREILGNHLTSCAQCTFEAEELQSLRATLTAVPARKSWLAWLREYPVLRPLPIAVAAMAFLSLLSVVWWLRQPAPQIVSAPPTVSPTALASLSPAPTPTPAVITSLQDQGQTITLDQAGKLTGLEGLSNDAEQALRRVLTTQQIEISPDVKALQQRPATLMSGSDAQAVIKLHSPVGTLVQDTRPVFRWQAVAQADSYTVLVLDANFNVVADSGPVTQTNWRSTTPLKRGQEYVWQVTAQVAGQRLTSTSASTPETHFKLLRAAQAQALQTSVQAHRSHLLRGTLYVQAGLLDEAEREYQALLHANPRSSLARRLLQQLRAVRK